MREIGWLDLLSLHFAAKARIHCREPREKDNKISPDSVVLSFTLPVSFSAIFKHGLSQKETEGKPGDK